MKKPPRSDKELVDDMIGFCSDLIQFTTNETFQSFCASKMCYMASLHALVLLGEASTKVSKDTKMEYPSIPWRTISDMRNVLVHWYHGVELHIAWETIQNRIPQLLPALKKIHAV